MDGPDGFPLNTPWRSMTHEQQVAYWQHQARRHEGRVSAMSDYDQLKARAEAYDQLLAQTQTDQQRAVAEAHRQGRAEALQQAGEQLVEQWIRAAAATAQVPPEVVNGLLPGLNRAWFLTAQGGVDTDRVNTYVSQIAPVPAAPAPPSGVPGQQPPPAPPTGPVPPVTPPRGPDFGQGSRASAKPSGLDAGREIARQRFAAANPSAQQKQ